MTDSKSYEKFNYLLRPSKQVERKLLIEALHHLVRAGYPIYEYTYLGFGSIYYADFILFHKYLFINRMTCVEWGNIPNRMKFNKPFKFIKLQMKPVSSVISRLNRKTKYLVWLDYDRPLDSEMLHDVDGFAQVVAPGSIFLITVEAEPRLRNMRKDRLTTERNDELLAFYQQNFGHLLVQDIKASNLSKNDLPKLLSKIIRSQLQTSLAGRADNVIFHQLFNFVYADGAQMITLGGVIDDEGVEAKISDNHLFANLKYLRQGDDPQRISVPPLTIREKQWIDHKLDERLSAKTLDIDDDLLANYVAFYKYYPTYFETLL